MICHFMMQQLVMLMASIVMIKALTTDDTNPAWRKIAESGPIVAPQVKGREDKPGM